MERVGEIKAMLHSKKVRNVGFGKEFIDIIGIL